MRVAVFDPFSGASGDMILGALIDAGASIGDMQRELDKLALPIEIKSEQVNVNAVRGSRVSVIADDSTHSRTWRDVRMIISGSTLSQSVKSKSLAVFERLANAEAKVHESDIDSVHFHEVGGLDAIADICGACIALDLLQIEQIYSGPLRTGSGFVRAAHGLLPVPAPATAELLAISRATISSHLPAHTESPGELLTPTGAAILTTLASFSSVAFHIESMGYGFGTRQLPWPNALRVWIGTAGESGVADGESVMETNIDDMSPQHMELLMERLFAAGALDVWLTPITMKKSRPATMVSAIIPNNRRTELETVFLENSTTLGVRVTAINRTKAIRRFETIATRWGEVTVKLRGWNGRVIDVAPEYDDCARLARESGSTLREVWNEAHRYAEAFVGRRISDSGDLV